VARRRSAGRYGKPGRRGRAVLEDAVHDAGFSRRTSVAAVDAVLNAWTGALCRQETVELPVGSLKVRENPPKRRVFRSKGAMARKLYDLYRQRFSVSLAGPEPL
jgi:nucleoid DNA-binding protein